MLRPLESFRNIWAVDFEFYAPDGERPRPLCVAACEVRSGVQIQRWLDDEKWRTHPPYVCDRDSVFLGFYASAEWSCHLALNWPMPHFVVDLYYEFRAATNGRPLPLGSSLLAAASWYGLDTMGVGEKDTMRELAMRGGEYSGEERAALMQYCMDDATTLVRLFRAMLPTLDFPRALLRGRYSQACAHMEHCGVPINAPQLATLREAWPALQGNLIRRVDAQYQVYEDGQFREERWRWWTEQRGILWPRLPTGRLALDFNTFRDMARLYPQIGPLHELRSTLAKLRLEKLAVGGDGRNRTLLSAFRAKTSRNAPSTARYIFGPATWIRSLIRPEPGYGLAYVDWRQQEYGIAAALSGDQHMQHGYLSGDPYLAFGIQSGMLPTTATKVTHGPEREMCKAVVLSIAYGVGYRSLAYRLGTSPAHAKILLELHRRTYKTFWKWADAAVDVALLSGVIRSVFGWPYHVSETVNVRSLQNFPAQSNGAECLRLGCCLMTEMGIQVCGPIHDAVLIHAKMDDLPQAVAVTQQCMEQASATVLAGFRLLSDATIVHYPHHYQDPRGSQMWHTVWESLKDLQVHH